MSDMINEFNSIIDELTEYRLGLTKLINNVKQLDSKISKTIKKHATNALEKPHKKPSGFAIPTNISKELSVFMKKKEGEKAARTEVTQYIIHYIKEKELQNKENKQEIILDDNLGKLLNCGTNTVTYFTIQKFMNQHFIHNHLDNI
jgi:chromatin remodeling complex protein RSC6